MNEAEGKVRVTNHKEMKNAVNAETRTTYEVIVNPSELRGIQVIWAIFADCDKKNINVLAPLINLLSKVYTSLSPTLPKELLRVA
jgi:hypothetical protein